MIPCRENFLSNVLTDVALAFKFHGETVIPFLKLKFVLHMLRFIGNRACF